MMGAWWSAPGRNGIDKYFFIMGVTVLLTLLMDLHFMDFGFPGQNLVSAVPEHMPCQIQIPVKTEAQLYIRSCPPR